MRTTTANSEMLSFLYKMCQENNKYYLNFKKDMYHIQWINILHKFRLKIFDKLLKNLFYIKCKLLQNHIQNLNQNNTDISNKMYTIEEQQKKLKKDKLEEQQKKLEIEQKLKKVKLEKEEKLRKEKLEEQQKNLEIEQKLKKEKLEKEEKLKKEKLKKEEKLEKDEELELVKKKRLEIKKKRLEENKKRLEIMEKKKEERRLEKEKKKIIRDKYKEENKQNLECENLQK